MKSTSAQTHVRRLLALLLAALLCLFAGCSAAPANHPPILRPKQTAGASDPAGTETPDDSAQGAASFVPAATPPPSPAWPAPLT